MLLLSYWGGGGGGGGGGAGEAGTGGGNGLFDGGSLKAALSLVSVSFIWEIGSIYYGILFYILVFG